MTHRLAFGVPAQLKAGIRRGMAAREGGSASCAPPVVPVCVVVAVPVPSSSSDACSHGLDLYPTGETALGASSTSHEWVT